MGSLRMTRILKKKKIDFFLIILFFFLTILLKEYPKKTYHLQKAPEEIHPRGPHDKSAGSRFASNSRVHIQRCGYNKGDLDAEAPFQLS